MAFLAPSLQRLFDECDTRWPDRDHWSDGWLGDSRHSHLLSDHNPGPDGMVHAIDIDASIGHVMGTGLVGNTVHAELLERCRDGRLDQVINYLIYDGHIYSKSRDYVKRVYTGLNAHESHVHVSIHYTNTAEQFAGSWGIQEKDWWDDVTRDEAKTLIDNRIEAAIPAIAAACADKLLDTPLKDPVSGEDKSVRTIVRYANWRMQKILGALGQ